MTGEPMTADLPAWLSPQASALTAEDRAQIADLMARYAWALDTDHREAVAALFTPDGVFDGVSGLYEGREQVHAMAARSRSHDDGALVQHWVANPVFEVDGPRVVVRSMCIGPAIDSRGSVAQVFVGSYVDVCVKPGDCWLFARRRWRPWDGTLVP